MAKKISISMCHWCPRAFKDDWNGTPYFCGKAQRQIEKHEIEQRAIDGTFEQWVIPEWCPLEDY